MKLCPRCLVEKPLTDFYKCPSAKDRHRATCKKCMNEEGRIRTRKGVDDLMKFFDLGGK